MLCQNRLQQQKQGGEASGLGEAPEVPSQVKVSSEADAKQQLKWIGSHFEEASSLLLMTVFFHVKHAMDAILIKPNLNLYQI